MCLIQPTNFFWPVAALYRFGCVRECKSADLTNTSDDACPTSSGLQSTLQSCSPRYFNCRCQLARMPRYTRRGRGRPPATTARAMRSSPRVSSRASRVAGQQSPPVATTQTVQPSTSGHSASVSLPPLPLNELLELVRTEVRAEMHPPGPSSIACSYSPNPACCDSPQPTVSVACCHHPVSSCRAVPRAAAVSHPCRCKQRL